jgi:hypothetical protein
MFETATKRDRMMNAKVGFILAAVVCIAILSIWNLMLILALPGRVPRPSLSLVVEAILCAAGIFLFKAALLRLAFAMAGTQAFVRAALWLAGAPRSLQRLAALGGKILIVTAAGIVIFVIVKWFGSTPHQSLSPDRESSTP